jgi:hypothetical protein
MADFGYTGHKSFWITAKKIRKLNEQIKFYLKCMGRTTLERIFNFKCVTFERILPVVCLGNLNQQTQRYKFTSHIAAFLSVVLITEVLEICIQTSYDQNVQLILKSYLPVVYGTTLSITLVQFSHNLTFLLYFDLYPIL